jgi:hypothetical protein
MKQSIECPLLGKEVKDKVTGFSGIAVSVHGYITGCTQYGVQPKVDGKGEIPKMNWIDEGRLIVTGDGISAEEVQGTEDGCCFREHPDK